MCNLGQGIAQENLQKGLEQGLKQGMEKGRFEDIRNLMDPLSLPLEQAMAALKIPASDQPIAIIKNNGKKPAVGFCVSRPTRGGKELRQF